MKVSARWMSDMDHLFKAEAKAEEAVGAAAARGWTGLGAAVGQCRLTTA